MRWKGFEPSRYCYRQPLKLVRLPVPPPPQKKTNRHLNCPTSFVAQRSSPVEDGCLFRYSSVNSDCPAIHSKINQTLRPIFVSREIAVRALTRVSDSEALEAEPGPESCLES